MLPGLYDGFRVRAYPQYSILYLLLVLNLKCLIKSTREQNFYFRTFITSQWNNLHLTVTHSTV